MTDDLRPPYRIAFDNARDPYTARNALGITSIAGSGGIAPANAQYITAASDATLTAERVATNTATVTWDFATAGQAKANVVAGSFGDVFKAANNPFTGSNTFASSGRTAFGHTALVDTLNVEVHGSNTATAGVAITSWAGAIAGGQPIVILQKTRAATVGGTRVAVAASDNLGTLQFRGDDATAFRTGVQINATAEAVPVGTGVPSRLVVFTANSAGTLTERMRIDSAGLATFAGDTTSANYPSGAWTAWTPTITAGSGTFTSTTINTARYTRHGKTITVYLDVTITNAGTAAGTFRFSLPVTASASGGGAIFGRDLFFNYLIGGVILPSETEGGLIAYNGVTLIATNARPVLVAVYEGV